MGQFVDFLVFAFSVLFGRCIDSHSTKMKSSFVAVFVGARVQSVGEDKCRSETKIG